MNFEMLRNKVPAAFADGPAPHVSERYQFVRTADVLSILDEDGWEVNSATQQNVRDPERSNTAKHCIELRRRGVGPVKRELGDLFPTLRIINSADWSSRLSIFWGIYRMICSNGMIAGSVYEAYNVKHDQIHEDIHAITSRFTSAANQLIDNAETWNGIELSDERVREFAMSAARIRFTEPNSDHANALIRVNRVEDDSNTLWNVFNTVQENAIQGTNAFGNMPRRVRAISNINENRRINQELFDLAHQFALN